MRCGRSGRKPAATAAVTDAQRLLDAAFPACGLGEANLLAQVHVPIWGFTARGAHLKLSSSSKPLSVLARRIRQTALLCPCSLCEGELRDATQMGR